MDVTPKASVAVLSTPAVKYWGGERNFELALADAIRCRKHVCSPFRAEDNLTVILEPHHTIVLVQNGRIVRRIEINHPQDLLCQRGDRARSCQIAN